MPEYKILTIIYDAALESDLVKVLEESGIEEYTIFPGLKGSWEKSKKHFNSHTWPGTDGLISVVLEKKDCDTLVEKYSGIKKSMDYYITFKMLVTPVDLYIR